MYRCRVCQKATNYKTVTSHTRQCGSGTMTDARKDKAFAALAGIISVCFKANGPSPDTPIVEEITEDDAQLSEPSNGP